MHCAALGWLLDFSLRLGVSFDICYFGKMVVFLHQNNRLNPLKVMNNADFWASIRSIITDGFTPDGLQKLDRYAEQFISNALVYQRFSPQEQHGCATGGATNVIASLLAGAEVGTDRGGQTSFSDFQRERQCATRQEGVIEQWAKRVGLWTDCVESTLPQSLGKQIAEGGEAVVYDHGTTLIKSIGLDYFIQPIFALDRISLHNT